jgi:hypothetical protein
VNKRETQILQLKNKFDFVCLQLFVYKEKHRGLRMSQSKRLEEEKCKYKEYSTLFWFILVLYVCSLNTIFHCRYAVLKWHLYHTFYYCKRNIWAHLNGKSEPTLVLDSSELSLHCYIPSLWNSFMFQIAHFAILTFRNWFYSLDRFISVCRHLPSRHHLVTCLDHFESIILLVLCNVHIIQEAYQVSNEHYMLI